MQLLKTTAKLAFLTLGAQLYRNKKSKLLYYHDVYGDVKYTSMGISLELFERHLEVIRKAGYSIVPRIENPDSEVALLFDDGFHGIYDVKRSFYDEGLCPTVFLAVSLIGQSGYLNVDEILELQQHGFIFESHGWSHSDMTRFDDLELKRELVESRQYLSELLGKNVRELCLPIGYYSNHLIEKAFEAGYDTIYSSVPGYYDDKVEGMRPRNLVQYASPHEVRLILQGGNTILRNHYKKLHKRK